MAYPIGLDDSMNLRQIFNILVVITGALAMIYGIAGMIADGPHGHDALFAIAGMALLVVPRVLHQFSLMMTGLTGLLLAAIWQGFYEGEFNAVLIGILCGVVFVLLSIFVRLGRE